MSSNSSYSPPAANNDFWRSGTGATLPDGTNDPTDAIARPGSVGVGQIDPTLNAAGLDVMGALLLRPFTIGNRAVDGVVGTANDTVDIYSTLVFNQTTANISLTVPTPTNTTAGRLLQITNNGTATIVVAGYKLAPATSATIIWDGNSWNPVGGRGFYAATAVSAGAGVATFTFPPGMFSVAPIVTTTMQTNSTSVLESRITTLTSAGCTITVLGSAVVSVLGISVVAAATPANGITVHLQATQAG